jgi:hypothetical protein
MYSRLFKCSKSQKKEKLKELEVNVLKWEEKK